MNDHDNPPPLDRGWLWPEYRKLAEENPDGTVHRDIPVAVAMYGLIDLERACAGAWEAVRGMELEVERLTGWTRERVEEWRDEHWEWRKGR